MSLENNTTSSAISIFSWPAVLSTCIACCGISMLAGTAHRMGRMTNIRDYRFRQNMLLLCSGILVISAAVAVNKFIE